MNPGDEARRTGLDLPLLSSYYSDDARRDLAQEALPTTRPHRRMRLVEVGGDLSRLGEQHVTVVWRLLSSFSFYRKDCSIYRQLGAPRRSVVGTAVAWSGIRCWMADCRPSHCISYADKSLTHPQWAAVEAIPNAAGYCLALPTQSHCTYLVGSNCICRRLVEWKLSRGLSAVLYTVEVSTYSGPLAGPRGWIHKGMQSGEGAYTD